MFVTKVGTRGTSMPWCTIATTVDFPIAYNAAIWAKLLAWASQCNTMASLLAWGSARLRWVVSFSKYLPYIWDWYQTVSLDMRKCCKYWLPSQSGYLRPILRHISLTSFSQKPRSLGTAKNRHGAWRERIISWKGDRARSNGMKNSRDSNSRLLRRHRWQRRTNMVLRSWFLWLVQPLPSWYKEKR